MLVSDILRTKGSEVMTVRPSEAIVTLAHRLRQQRVGAMIVSENGETIEGIISERDIAHGVAEHGAALMDMHVSDLMTTSVISCKTSDTIGDIAKIMTNHRIRHLPVVEGTHVVGIVTIGDVVKQRMDELQLEANVMRDYAIARV